MTEANALVVRPMDHDEVVRLVSWAAAEGWNPGRSDAEIFWKTDPDAFIAAELEGELVGGGAITAYGDAFGFMGLFIVRPEFRGRGLGDRLWHARLARLCARLRPNATIGMDGVFDMQGYYAKGGFEFSHRNLRFQADVPTGYVAPETARGEVVPVADVTPEEIARYDRSCFPAERPTFLDAWISQPDAEALGFVRGDGLAGYGVVRRCGTGCKIGPLFADDAESAESLYARLAEFAAGGPLFLDAPENNPAAMDLVRRHGMAEVFGCARMYVGPRPDVRHERVFGVTTFELG